MKGRAIINILILLPVLALLLAGCGPDSVSPGGGRFPAEAEEYFTLHIGNYWEYDLYQNGSLQNRIKYAFIDTVRHTDGSLLYIRQQDDYPDTCYFWYYTRRDDGIYFYLSPSDTSTSCWGQVIPIKRKIMLSEMRPGDRWNTYDSPGSFPRRFTVRTGMSIHVGDYFFGDVILVEEKSKYATEYLYYAKDVGLVKGIYEYDVITSVLEIDEYHVHSTD